MTDKDLQQKRLIAAAIDGVIAIAIGVVTAIAGIALGIITRSGDSGTVSMMIGRALSFGGALVGLGYILCRDVLAGDRSIGKKIQDIRVVGTTGGQIGFMDSVNRNLIFGIGSSLSVLSTALGLFPCVGDMVRCLLSPLLILGYLIGLVAAIVEIVKITQDPAGVRFGDQFAGTRVVR